MNALRIALVTRRYWPLTGEPETLLSNLAAEFLQRGVKTVVVTAQWSPDWSTSVVHRETRVARIPQSRARGWGEIQYVAGLSRWLRRRHGQFDVVCVSRMRYDAYAALGALRRGGPPVVLRAEEEGAEGECRWQQQARFGRRIQRRCRTADAIIAPSAAIEQELHVAEYPPQRVHRIANCPAPVEPRSPQSRRLARRALADINHDLTAHDQAPVAVCSQPLADYQGLAALFDAWRPVARRWPHSQLWLIGDGPQRERLYERLVDLGLHHQVLMPGSFDDLQEVLCAADLFVAPSADRSASYNLLQAMAAGLPVIAADTGDNRELIRPPENGLLTKPGDARSLGEAIIQLIDDPRRAAIQGAQGRSALEACRSLETMVEQHLHLFERLAAPRGVMTK